MAIEIDADCLDHFSNSLLSASRSIDQYKPDDWYIDVNSCLGYNRPIWEKLKTVEHAYCTDESVLMPRIEHWLMGIKAEALAKQAMES